MNISIKFSIQLVTPCLILNNHLFLFVDISEFETFKTVIQIFHNNTCVRFEAESNRCYRIMRGRTNYNLSFNKPTVIKKKILIQELMDALEFFAPNKIPDYDGTIKSDSSSLNNIGVSESTVNFFFFC